MELTQRGKSAHAGDAEDPHQEHKTDLSSIHLEQAGSVDSDEPRPLEDRPSRNRSTCLWVGVGIGVVLIVAMVLVVARIGSSTGDGQSDNKNSDADSYSGVATGRHGVVAATNNLAAKAGMETLKAGGNAVDAAAVVQFMLAVAQPESTGLGGGLLALYYDAAADSVRAIDGREEAPAAFSEDAFCTNSSCVQAIPFYPDRVTGGHSAGVPGTVAAVTYALKKYGTYTLAQAVAPAVKLARGGIPMTQHLMERLRLFPATKALFLSADGSRPIAKPGEMWYNPDLANTMELIAASNAEEFYTGAIARDIVAAVKAAANPVTHKAGLMEMSDLAQYRAVERLPTHVEYNGHTVYGHAPPSSGFALLTYLQLLDGVDLAGMIPGRAAAIRRLVDAQNIGWADREYDGDADFATVPVDAMLNATYQRQRQAQYMRLAKATPTPVPGGQYIKDAVAAGGSGRDMSADGSGARRRRMQHDTQQQQEQAASYRDEPGYQHLPTSYYSPYGKDGYVDKHGTTHFSIIDKDRNVVAWTTTIEENLGCGVVVPNRGFLMNNELTDFDPLPLNPLTGIPGQNRPEGGKKPRRTALGDDATTIGGKRPRSSMSPTIVLEVDSSTGERRPLLALGSPGGSTIIGTVFNVLTNVLDHGMNLFDAVAAPRVVARGGSTVLMEHQLTADAKLMAMMKESGINPTDQWGRRPLGFVQAARAYYDAQGGYVEGAADHTRLDTAAAFAY